ncbi:MAG: hypothetical protein WEA04_04260 [Candidatus Andersenbacteria bacterium]
MAQRTVVVLTFVAVIALLFVVLSFYQGGLLQARLYNLLEQPNIIEEEVVPSEVATAPSEDASTLASEAHCEQVKQGHIIHCGEFPAEHDYECRTIGAEAAYQACLQTAVAAPELLMPEEEILVSPQPVSHSGGHTF